MILSRRLRGGFVGKFLFVKVPHDARDVRFCLVIRRHAAILLYALRTGIVGGQSLDEVKVVTLQKFTKVSRSAFYIRLCVICILHTELRGSLRHQLHQASCPLRRECPHVESTLGANHTVHEVGVQTVGAAGSSYYLIQIDWLLRRLRRGWKFGLNLSLRREIIRSGFEVVDVSGWNVYKAGIVSVDEQPGDSPNDFATLLTDGKSIAENRRVGPR